MINRIKKTLSAIPASIAEAAGYLASIGEKQAAINRVKRETKAEVDRLNADAQKKITDLTKDRDNFFVALFAFAAPRKAELTKERRTVGTTAGTFGWRWTTPYVELAEGKTDEDILKALKRSGRTEYIRTIEELDREAMLRDRPVIAGVSYTQRDEFFAKPKLAKGEGRSVELVTCLRRQEELPLKSTEAIDV